MRLSRIFNDFKKIFFKNGLVKPDLKYFIRTKKFSSTKKQKTEHLFINRLLNKFLIKSILDFGCNDGILKLSLSKKISYSGIDTNTALKKKKLFSKNIKIYKNKIPNFKYKLDCILLSHVIGHLENKDFVINTLIQKLKKSGILIIITPNKYFKILIFLKNLINNYEPDPTVIRYYSKQEILRTNTLKRMNLIYYKNYSIVNNSIIEKKIGERLIFVFKK